jgi:alpha-L-fucosidase
MKKLSRKLLSLILMGTMATSSLFAQTTSVIGESDSAKDVRMDWFAHAKLGIFIHWGIYAVNGISESWSFFNEHISLEDYNLQEKGFTASKFNAKEWVDLIQESGARYTVITTKHHDGMALWNTKQSDRNVVKRTPAKRDLIDEFAKEVRSRDNLHLGFYFSLLDWSHPNYPHITRTKDRYKDDPARWEKFRKFNFAQLKELNTTWHPDLYWFDGDWEQTAEAWDSKGIVNLLHSDNKNVIVNSRIQGYGDYGTPEIGVPVVRPNDKYWELCLTMNDSWGYQPLDTLYKTPYMLLRTFVDCLSNGGNLLLDIGPKADGTIPAEQVAILKEFGRWTKKHAEAIYDTRAGMPAEHFQGYTSYNMAGDVVYLYVPYRPNGIVEVKGLLNNVKRAWVVGDGTELNFSVYNRPSWSGYSGNLYIEVPDSVLDPQITVIGLQLDGPVRLYRSAGQVIESN